MRLRKACVPILMFVLTIFLVTANLACKSSKESESKAKYKTEVAAGIAKKVKQETKEELLSISKQGKWGLIKLDGLIVIPPQYDAELTFYDDLAVAAIGNKYGYIDKKNRMVITARYDFTSTSSVDAMFRSHGLALVNEANRMKIIDRKGNNILDVSEYQEVSILSNGLIFASKEGINDEHDVFNQNGKHIMPYRLVPEKVLYQEMIFASPGVPFVVEGKIGLMKGDGKWLLEPNYDELGSFSENGLAPASIDGKYGYINRKGDFVIEPRYTAAFEFSEGMAVVGSNGKFGYINEKGKVVIQPQFFKAGAFSDGTAIIEDEMGQKGLVDSRGRIVLQPSYEGIGEFSEGLASCYRDFDNLRYGYIDKSGREIIAPQFGSADDFCEGLAAVRIGKLWGFINKTGAMVIPAQFDYVLGFSDGIAKVILNERAGYINSRGDIVIEPQFDTTYNFSGECKSERIKVGINGKYGYYDKSGKLLTGLIFDDASDFTEHGVARVRIGQDTTWIDKSGKLLFDPR